MNEATRLVVGALFFAAAGFALGFGALLLGKVLRPSRPGGVKGEIYECGEPTIGSAWVQFDLRFYVVALLFVLFAVEIAMLYPWAATPSYICTIIRLCYCTDMPLYGHTAMGRCWAASVTLYGC